MGMNKVSMLDCTLRDGGWVNQFQFGRTAMEAVIRETEAAGIEYVELGYLDEKRGSCEDRSEYSDLQAIGINGLDEGGKKAQRFVMIDWGKYPVSSLPVQSASGIQGIRLCFHKKDIEKALEAGQGILEKGYLLMLQPMVCSRYTEGELKELVIRVREELEGAAGFYIVDSFGSMTEQEIKKRMILADGLLPSSIALGLHAHNNLNRAFSNGMAALNLDLEREIILDSTLEGIGKGAGNIKSEELAAYLNRRCQKTYDAARLKSAALRWIRPIAADHVWGCSPEYELSARYGMTPTYASFFFREHQCSLSETEKLLGLIPDQKKDSFDREMAERVWYEYKINGENRGGRGI